MINQKRLLWKNLLKCKSPRLNYFFVNQNLMEANKSSFATAHQTEECSFFDGKNINSLAKYMKKLPHGKIALARKFTLKQKAFQKITHSFEYSFKSFAQKNGSVWKCRKKLFWWIAHAYGWLNKTLIFKNKSRCNSKRNKCKSDTFVRPPCIMIKAVLNLLIILRESYLIPLYILTVKLFQKSIAAMYLFTKSFRA